MNQDLGTQTPVQFQRNGRGRICRCLKCGGMRFQFGNLSTHLDAETFLRLANFVHQATTVLGPKLKEGEHIVIPFSSGNFSQLVDLEQLADLSSLIQLGLRWLDEREDSAGLPVN